MNQSWLKKSLKTIKGKNDKLHSTCCANSLVGDTTTALKPSFREDYRVTK